MTQGLCKGLQKSKCRFKGFQEEKCILLKEMMQEGDSEMQLCPNMGLLCREKS